MSDVKKVDIGRDEDARAGTGRGADVPVRRRPRHSHQSAGPGTYIGLGVLFVIVLFPVYYGIVGSFMNTADTNSYPPAMWPVHGLHPSNYTDALKIIPLGNQYLNSILQTAFITAGQVLTSLLAAYAFVFLPMRWRGFWFAVFLSTMMIPYESIIIPNYLFMSDFGLINSMPALTLPFLAHGFGIFLLRQAFMSFPRELYEAARIDGCSNFGFLTRILLPLSRPTLAALGIWTFLMAWNMYFWPLLVTQTPEMQTIQIGITQLQSADNFNAGLVMAGTVLAIVPTLLLLIFGQRFIVRGLTGGSLK